MYPPSKPLPILPRPAYCGADPATHNQNFVRSGTDSVLSLDDEKKEGLGGVEWVERSDEQAKVGIEVHFDEVSLGEGDDEGEGSDQVGDVQLRSQIQDLGLTNSLRLEIGIR